MIKSREIERKFFERLRRCNRAAIVPQSFFNRAAIVPQSLPQSLRLQEGLQSPF